jgi:hypothetical protein
MAQRLKKRREYSIRATFDLTTRLFNALVQDENGEIVRRLEFSHPSELQELKRQTNLSFLSGE